MKKIIISVAAATVASGAFAQAKNFEGFFVEGGVAIGSPSNKFSYANQDGDFASGSNQSKDYIKGKISLGYMHALNEKFLLGAAFGGILGSTTVSEYSASNGEFDKSQAKNKYSLALIPAYVLSDNLLVRGRVSYNKVKIEGTGLTDTNGGGQIVSLASDTYSAKLNGIGLGIGAQYYFTKNIYGAIDLERVMYSSKNLDRTRDGVARTDSTLSLKANETVGLISVGYKF